MQMQKPKGAKAIVKNHKVRGLTLPHIMMYDNAIVIKTMWYWRKDKQTNEIENLKTHK